jgi:AraC-like DNA-binding protein
MILNYISFFIGCILLFFLPIVINKSKSGEKLNKYFFAIIAIAGIQRFIFGLINFGIINVTIPNFNIIIILGFFIPSLYYVFASNLMLQPTTSKQEIIIFSISAIIVLIIFAFNLDKNTNQILFCLYSTIYLGLFIFLFTKSFKIKKSIIDFDRNKNSKYWTVLIFILFIIIYISSNYSLYVFLDEINYVVLKQFNNLTSFIWLLIIIYLLMNPINLYGEEVLIKKLNNSKITEIQIWKTIKRIKTEANDLDVEKKIAPNLVKVLFDINSFETNLYKDFKKLPTLKEFGLLLGHPQSHIKYVFKYYCNYTYSEYLTILKIKYSIQLIEDGYLKLHTIDSLAKKCLFESRITFFNNFKKNVGHSPSNSDLYVLRKDNKTTNNLA